MSIYIIIVLLLQIDPRVLTPDGGIAAEWVLVSVVFVAFFLFWHMLKKIENGMEKVFHSVQLHETKLQLHQQAIEDLEEVVFKKNK